MAIYKGLDIGKPGDTIIVLESAGFSPQETIGGSTLPHFEKPRFQIISRSTAYQTARTNIEAAFRTLNAVSNQDISSTSGGSTATYMRIQALQSPFSVGRDDKKRHLLSCNFQCQRLST